jgi:hypothetical protein
MSVMVLKHWLFVPLELDTDLISHPHLENRAMLLSPPLCYSCMIRPQLVQASKQRKAWHFWKALDVWCICSIQQFVKEEAQDCDAGDVNRYRHDHDYSMKDKN